MHPLIFKVSKSCSLSGIWVLGELRLVQGVPPVLALKTQQLDAVIPVQTALSVLVASE